MSEFEGWLRGSLPCYFEAIIKAQRDKRLTLSDLSGTHFDDCTTVDIPNVVAVFRRYVPKISIHSSSSEELEQIYMKVGHPEIFSELTKGNSHVLNLLDIYSETMALYSPEYLTPLHPLQNPFTVPVKPKDVENNVAKKLAEKGLVNVVQTPKLSSRGINAVLRLSKKYHAGLGDHIVRTLITV